MGLQETLYIVGGVVFIAILLDALRRKNAAQRQEQEPEYEDPEEKARQEQLARELPGLDPLFDEIDDVFDDDPIPVLRNKQNLNLDAAKQLEPTAHLEPAKQTELNQAQQAEEAKAKAAKEAEAKSEAQEQAWEAMRKKFSLDPAFAQASQIAVQEQQEELQKIQAVKAQTQPEEKLTAAAPNKPLAPEQLDDLVDIKLPEKPQPAATPADAQETQLRRELLNNIEKNAWGRAEQFISIAVNAPAGTPFPSSLLLKLMDSINLQYSDSGVLHFVEEKNGQHYLGFSLLNMFEPGYFDFSQDFQTKGVVLVMALPNSPKPMQMFERLLATAKAMERSWGAVLQDGDRSDLTQQTIQHYRQTIKDFEYQTQVAAMKAQRENKSPNR